MDFVVGQEIPSKVLLLVAGQPVADQKGHHLLRHYQMGDGGHEEIVKE